MEHAGEPSRLCSGDEWDENYVFGTYSRPSQVFGANRQKAIHGRMSDLEAKSGRLAGPLHQTTIFTRKWGKKKKETCLRSPTVSNRRTGTPFRYLAWRARRTCNGRLEKVEADDEGDDEARESTALVSDAFILL